jgi:hypothetical protein
MENLTFAFVADEDVFHYLQIPNDPRLEGVIAGLRSGPRLVEVSTGSPETMGVGWKYIDGKFVAPEIQESHDHDHTDEDDYEVED